MENDCSDYFNKICFLNIFYQMLIDKKYYFMKNRMEKGCSSCFIKNCRKFIYRFHEDICRSNNIQDIS